MRYTQIPVSLFIKNRKKLLKLMDDNSFAIIHSSEQMPRNGDLFYPYRQSSDFFYLTGIEQEQSVLFLCPKHPDESLREILFIRKPNEHLEIWEGQKLTKDYASKISGIATIMWDDEFTPYIEKITKQIHTVFLNKNDNPRFSSPIKSKDEIFTQKFKETYTDVSVKNIAPLITMQRMVKSKAEIEIIKQACNITRNAFYRVLEKTQPGLYEYEIEAEIIHEFIRHGSSGHAYEPIIASGKNACYLHYTKNDTKIQNGDLVLMDFGAEYANYASDLSRTIPANGKFNKRQKEVYSATLRVLKQARSMLRVGTMLDQYQKEVGKIMESELIGLGLFTKADAERQDPKSPLYFKYFMHGTSHFIGIDTHDIGDKTIPLQEGTILSCEPGIYIPEENIGIRIENDILVTEDGPVDLMEDIPVEIEEIEDIMNNGL